MPAKKESKRPETRDAKTGDDPGSESAQADKGAKEKATKTPLIVRFPSGSYIIRMDQPCSRIADALLDYQYWSPDDPQKSPFDDTGWTFGELFNVRVVRVTDLKVLDTPMERVAQISLSGGVAGRGSVLVINQNGDTARATLRYVMKDVSIEAAEDPFEAAGQRFNRGSFILKNADAAKLQRAASELGLKVFAIQNAPSVRTHAMRVARIALLHTWLSTQADGWWRLAFDRMQISYDYISTQEVARNSDLRAEYDVILFPPVGRRDPLTIVNGLSVDWGSPLPWKTTPETPNIGKIDSTDDIRPGLGWTGVAHLQDFVKKGGVLVTVMDTSNLAVSLGLTRGVSVERPQQVKVIGSILRAQAVDAASPIAYGYGESLSIYCDDGPIFEISNLAPGEGRRRNPDQSTRPTGRGTLDDPDFTPGRPAAEAPEEPRAEAWETQPVTDEERRNGIALIPPAQRPRVVFRYADSKDLLVSGLLEGGDEIAQHAAVVDVPVGAGHIILFSNNLIYRGETLGSYSLVLNTILNFDSLNAERKLAEK